MVRVALLLWSAPARAQESAPPPPALPAVREIVRGYWMEADLGSTRFLGTDGIRRPCADPGGCPLLTGGLGVGLTVGDDFVDRDRVGATWEVRVGEALFNGPSTDDLAAMAAEGVASPVEGDALAFSGTGALAVAVHPSRRIGIGGRVGGGVVALPVLMAPDGYQREVLDRFGVASAVLHDGPLPLALVGLSLRYDTKLAHFSVAADLDASYVVGFDLALAPRGSLRYTFGAKSVNPSGAIVEPTGDGGVR